MIDFRICAGVLKELFGWNSDGTAYPDYLRDCRHVGDPLSRSAVYLPTVPSRQPGLISCLSGDLTGAAARLSSAGVAEAINLAEVNSALSPAVQPGHLLAAEFSVAQVFFFFLNTPPPIHW